MGKLSALAICMVSLVMMSVDGKVYTIGGWMDGDESSFLKTWNPILEQYLTTAIDELPVTFRLVAADFQEQQSFARMISDGLLDFICKFSDTCLHLLPGILMIVAFAIRRTCRSHCVHHRTIQICADRYPTCNRWTDRIWRAWINNNFGTGESSICQ
jgi:hypothetical protein